MLCCRLPLLLLLLVSLCFPSNGHIQAIGTDAHSHVSLPSLVDRRHPPLVLGMQRPSLKMQKLRLRDKTGQQRPLTISSPNGNVDAVLARRDESLADQLDRDSKNTDDGEMFTPLAHAKDWITGDDDENLAERSGLAAEVKARMIQYSV